VLDFIGDIYLLGKPIKGIVCRESGHYLNQQLLNKLSSRRNGMKEKVLLGI